MKPIFNILLWILPFLSFAQWHEDFSDGNFTDNPSWTGDDSVFTIVNDDGNPQLRSNKHLPNSTYYLSVPSSQVTGQWEFSVRLAFNTSGANYTDVFLIADQANLKSTSLNGYFVRIGGTPDEVSLYRRISGTDMKLIDGQDGITNSSNNILKIKVIRDDLGSWKLERDASGSGNNYISEGVATDTTMLSGTHFGIFIAHSASSFFNKHFFDDLYVGPVIYDTTPPSPVSASVSDIMHIDLRFSEPVDEAGAQLSESYSLSSGVSIDHAERDAADPALVHLTLQNSLSNGASYTLTVTGIPDLAGNPSALQTLEITCLLAEIPVPGDVILTEFLCDPSPSAGLPELEFVEIYNRSDKYFHLSGWKLGDDSSEGTITEGWLYPGQYKVLCATSAVDSFPGTIAVTSFPGFGNAGDAIILKDNGGQICDRLTYTDAWYRDPVKKQGGYTIELINPNDPCSDVSNWKASMAPTGGTPGAPNSVNDTTPDTEAPGFARLEAMAPDLLFVTFNEAIDSSQLADATAVFGPGLTMIESTISGAFPSGIVYRFQETLAGSQSYSITLHNVADCWSNHVTLSGTFVLPEDAEPGDLSVNEILFDPRTGGSDFVELRNNSEKVIDLYGLLVANAQSDTADITQHFLVPPGEYAVLTEDSSFQLAVYSSAVPGTFIGMDLPAFGNDSGTVQLIGPAGLLDVVSYSADWHFKLLDDPDGKSLERIDPSGNSNDPDNWHTAAESLGFATPGRENSQFSPAVVNGNFSFSSDIISPDNDGNEDFLQISYTMQQPGMVATLTIFDDRGRLVKTLAKSELLGSSGSITWDGLTENSQKAPIGTYILLFEAFEPGGELFAQKKAFVVGAKI